MAKFKITFKDGYPRTSDVVEADIFEASPHFIVFSNFRDPGVDQKNFWNRQTVAAFQAHLVFSVKEVSQDG